MKTAFKALMVAASLAWCLAAVGQQAAAPAPPPVETETVGAGQTPAPANVVPTAAEGVMEAAQVKGLLHRLWLAEYRINDLLTQVRPEGWKISPTARASFNDSLTALRQQMSALEEWRGQFDVRPDSMYLGFMTHASIDAILPRLDGVTQLITQRENASLGAQFSQAGNQLFDVQQALQPYLVALLRNQDQLFYAAQTNLAACESRLGAALHGQSQPAKIIHNIVPEFKGRRVRKATTPAPATPPSPTPSRPSPGGQTPRK